MNYDKFFKEGDTKRVTIEEFNSNNTRRLNLEETKEKLIALVNDEMQNALAQQTQALTDYINNQMKPMLMEELRTDINRSLSVMQENLYERLYEHLYEVLFEHLFNALYVPEPESERFVPLI